MDGFYLNNVDSELCGAIRSFCYVANVYVPVFPKIVHILHQLIASLSGERGGGGVG